MALKWIEGFDYYNTGTTGQTEMRNGKWNGGSWTNGGASGPQAGGQFTGGNNKHFKVGDGGGFGNPQMALGANYTTFVIGFAFKKVSSLSTNVIVYFLDSGSNQVELGLTAAGALRVLRNGTQIGISADGIITADAWNYIELKLTVDNSAGSFDLHLNGSSVASGSSLDTQNTANAYINQVWFFGPSEAHLDDMYFLDTTGSLNNDFLGTFRVATLMPTADGTHSDFTPSSGSDHYALVDEIPANDDTDYNSSNTTGHRDTFTFPALGINGEIAGVSVNFKARIDDAGTPTAKATIRRSAADYDGSPTHSPSSTYKHFTNLFETDPSTTAQWDEAGVDAGEYGVKIEAA